MIEIKDVEGKGKGYFAKAKLPRGTRILAEEPILQVDPAGTIESVLSAFSQLSSEQQAAYLDLHENASPAFRALPYLPNFSSTSQKIYAIWTVNHFGYGDIYMIGSRINHSCNPNVAHCFPHRRRIFHAMHDIEAGEELNISYIEETMTRAHRQLKLSSFWGFDCSCEHCEDTPENTVLEQKRDRISDIDCELELIQMDGSGRDGRGLALYQEKASILEALDVRQYNLSQWSV